MKVSSRKNIHLINFIASTTDSIRKKRIIKRSRGFLYILSVTGVTGSRKKLPEGLPAFLSGIRRQTRTPMALGFGISRKEQILPLKKFVDGFIVGSALLNVVINSLDMPKKMLYNKIRNFIKPLKGAL